MFRKRNTEYSPGGSLDFQRERGAMGAASLCVRIDWFAPCRSSLLGFKLALTREREPCSMELPEQCKLSSERLQAPALDISPEETWHHELLPGEQVL